MDKGSFWKELEEPINSFKMFDMGIYIELNKMVKRNLIEVNEKVNGIAYNDGRKITLYKNFFEMDIKEKTFVILHELMHIKFEHPFRLFQKITTYRDKNINVNFLINVAFDLAVNSAIVKMMIEIFKLKDFIKIPRNTILPEKIGFEPFKCSEFYLLKLLEIENINEMLRMLNYDKYLDIYNSIVSNTNNIDVGKNLHTNSNNSNCYTNYCDIEEIRKISKKSLNELVKDFYTFNISQKLFTINKIMLSHVSEKELIEYLKILIRLQEEEYAVLLLRKYTSNLTKEKRIKIENEILKNLWKLEKIV